MINKIAFIHYYTADMKRSVEFYRDTLGLKILFERDDWSEFDVGGQRLAIYRVDKVIRPEPAGGAVVWLEANPIEGIIEKLKDQGVKFEEELKTFPFGKLASFLDPDGNLLGLYESPPS